MVRVGINGFGRIGRAIFRAAVNKCAASSCNPQIVALNEPNMTTDQMAYHIKFDSTYGPFQGDVSVIGNTLKVNGQIIDVRNEKDPRKIPWKDSCVKYVVESSGTISNENAAIGHLKEGVKGVLITGPTSDAPTLVVGVNHDLFNTKMRVVSLSSACTNCLAPVIKTMHEAFGIEFCLINCMQPPLTSQSSQDSWSKNCKLGRGAMKNITPVYSSTAAELSKVICELDGKMVSISTKVPVATGMLADVTVKLCQLANLEAIKCKVRAAAEGPMRDILCFNDDRIVSSDVIANSNSAIFDGDTILILDNTYVKMLVWGDNEWGYASRVVDMLKYIAAMEACDK